MRAFRIVPAIFTTLIALCGCAVSNVEPGHDLAKPGTTGILTVGITSGPEPLNGSWMLRKIGSSEELGINFWTHQDPATWTNPTGRLAIVELEAGEWEFYDWGMIGSFSAAEYLSIPFRISPGRVTYLGRLHLEISKEKESFDVSISDHFDEDYATLKSFVPRLEADEVSRPPVGIGRCRAPPCEKEGTLDWVPIIIPIPIP